MKFQMKSKAIRGMLAMFTSACFLVVGSGCSEESQTAVTETASPQTFATMDEAAKAIIDAANKYDVAALAKILGTEGNELVFVGPPAEDKLIVTAFSELAQEKHELAVDPNNENFAFLNIGEKDWPFAIPLVRENGKWFFDAAQGKEELIYRRVGGNELDTIEVCRGYIDAQQVYATEKHDDSTVNQYAQWIISSEGKQDGLAWKNADGTWGGPIGESAAKAIADGFEKSDPFNGYYFKVLKRQGPDAPMGEMDYMIKGAMIGGFALAAAPAQYGVTGVMSFIVSNDGVVYQQDLGEDSLEIFKQLEEFNPDESWTAVPEDVE